MENTEWLCGPPDLIIEKLMAIQERYPGLEQIDVSCANSTPQSMMLEQLERFGEEVMPAFKGRVTAPVTAD